jgi:hypothetical protein
MSGYKVFHLLSTERTIIKTRPLRRVFIMAYICQDAVLQLRQSWCGVAGSVERVTRTEKRRAERGKRYPAGYQSACV